MSAPEQDLIERIKPRWIIDEVLAVAARHVHREGAVETAKAISQFIVANNSLKAEAVAEIERLRKVLSGYEAALTPSGDTKAAYLGEFRIAIERRVDDDGEVDDESEGASDPYEHIQVPWTTIKEIMAAIRRVAAE